MQARDFAVLTMARKAGRSAKHQGPSTQWLPPLEHDVESFASPIHRWCQRIHGMSAQTSPHASWKRPKEKISIMAGLVPESVITGRISLSCSCSCFLCCLEHTHTPSSSFIIVILILALAFCLIAAMVTNHVHSSGLCSIGNHTHLLRLHLRRTPEIQQLIRAVPLLQHLSGNAQLLEMNMLSPKSRFAPKLLRTRFDTKSGTSPGTTWTLIRKWAPLDTLEFEPFLLTHLLCHSHTDKCVVGKWVLLCPVQTWPWPHDVGSTFVHRPDLVRTPCPQP